MSWALAAQAAANAAGNVLGRLGQSEGNKAYGRAVDPYIDEYGELAQGQFDWTESQYQPQVGYGQEAMNNMWEGIQNDEFNVPDQQFEYGQDVNDFLSPSMAFEQAEAKKSLEGTYGGSSLLSGPAMAELMGRSQDIGRTNYNNAMGQMNQDRSFKYGAFGDALNRTRQRMQDKLSQLGGMVRLGQTGMANIGNARQNLTNTQQNMAQQRGQIAGTNAADDASFWYDIAGGVLGGAGQAAPAISGIMNQAQPQMQVDPSGFQYNQMKTTNGGESMSDIDWNNRGVAPTTSGNIGYDYGLGQQMGQFDNGQSYDINSSIWG